MYRPILNTVSFALVFISKKAYNVLRKTFFSIKLKQKFFHVLFKLKNLFNKKKKKKKKGKERKIALDRKESGQKNAAELIYVLRVSFSANLHLRLIQ